MTPDAPAATRSAATIAALRRAGLDDEAIRRKMGISPSLAREIGLVARAPPCGPTLGPPPAPRAETISPAQRAREWRAREWRAQGVEQSVAVAPAVPPVVALPSPVEVAAVLQPAWSAAARRTLRAACALDCGARLAAVRAAAAGALGVPDEALAGARKERCVAWPRQLAMAACRALVPMATLSQIGAAFGGRDHTTVRWSLLRVEERAAFDPTCADDLAAALAAGRASLAARGEAASEGGQDGLD